MRIPRSISLLAVVGLMTAAASVAQPQSVDSKTSTPGATASVSLEGEDGEFLTKAAQAGRDEVDEAQIAMQSAQREDVRNVASMMLEDHQRANLRLQDLARKKGWPLPVVTTAQRDQLRGDMTGGEFDSNYLAEEIRDHKEAISLYRKQAASGADPDLQKFAADSLPKLEHHLDMLEAANTGR